MKLRAVQFLVLAILLAASFSAQASAVRCEAVFVNKTPLDSLILENGGLPTQLTPKLLPANGGQAAVRVIYGRFGGGVETFEEAIDLSREKVEGLEVRKLSDGEGQSLSLHVRLRSSMNDIWKVSLASEMDAMAFLISSKAGMQQRAEESFEAQGFVIKAALPALASLARASGLPSEVRIGSDYKIVAIETAVTKDHHKDSVLVLKLQDVKTSEMIELKSARTAQGLKVARLLLTKGKATLSLQGNTFVLKENLAPGRLAPRSSAL